MVQDGSDAVQKCPDGAIVYYLQGFEVVPGMVHACVFASARAAVFAQECVRAHVCACVCVGKAQNSVQNGTSRVFVLGGTYLRTPLYSGGRNASTSQK